MITVLSLSNWFSWNNEFNLSFESIDDMLWSCMNRSMSPSTLNLAWVVMESDCLLSSFSKKAPISYWLSFVDISINGKWNFSFELLSSSCELMLLFISFYQQIICFSSCNNVLLLLSILFCARSFFLLSFSRRL